MIDTRLVLVFTFNWLREWHFTNHRVKFIKTKAIPDDVRLSMWLNNWLCWGPETVRNDNQNNELWFEQDSSIFWSLHTPSIVTEIMHDRVISWSTLLFSGCLILYVNACFHYFSRCHLSLQEHISSMMRKAWHFPCRNCHQVAIFWINFLWS